MSISNRERNHSLNDRILIFPIPSVLHEALYHIFCFLLRHILSGAPIILIERILF